MTSPTIMGHSLNLFRRTRDNLREAMGHLGDNGMYIDEAKHFLACIRGETAPACDGWDGLKTMRVIDAAVKSSAERRWVRV